MDLSIETMPMESDIRYLIPQPAGKEHYTEGKALYWLV